MKKIFKLCELGCANCAAKMEDKIGKLDGVTLASINFFTQTLTIEAEEACFDEIIKKSQKIIRKIEPDCYIEL